MPFTHFIKMSDDEKLQKSLIFMVLLVKQTDVNFPFSLLCMCKNTGHFIWFYLPTSFLKNLKIEKTSEKRYCLGYCGKMGNCGKLIPIPFDRTRKFIWDSSVFQVKIPAISETNEKNVNDLYHFGSHMKFPARSIGIGPNFPRFLILPQ